jgi:hypothetical protein
MTDWTRKQDRQNKANSGTGRPVQGPARRPVPPVGPVVQTKPICRQGQRRARAGEVTSGVAARAYCAKQTQFAPDGRGRPSSRPGALAMPPVKRANAPNKANFRPSGRREGSGTCHGERSAAICRRMPATPELRTGRKSCCVGRREYDIRDNGCVGSGPQVHNSALGSPSGRCRNGLERATVRRIGVGGP